MPLSAGFDAPAPRRTHAPPLFPRGYPVTDDWIAGLRHLHRGIAGSRSLHYRSDHLPWNRTNDPSLGRDAAALAFMLDVPPDETAGMVGPLKNFRATVVNRFRHEEPFEFERALDPLGRHTELYGTASGQATGRDRLVGVEPNPGPLPWDVSTVETVAGAPITRSGILYGDQYDAYVAAHPGETFTDVYRNTGSYGGRGYVSFTENGVPTVNEGATVQRYEAAERNARGGNAGWQASVGIEPNPGPRARKAKATRVKAKGAARRAAPRARGPVGYRVAAPRPRMLASAPSLGLEQRPGFSFSRITDDPGVHAVRVSGRYYAGFLSTKAAQTNAKIINSLNSQNYLSINPQNIFAASSPIKTLCSTFLKFRFRKLSIEYCTSAATSTTGNVALAYQEDPVNSDVSFDTILGAEVACSTPVWNPRCTLNVTPSSAVNWYSQDVSPSPDGRFNYQGGFAFAANGTLGLADLTTVGSLWFDFVLDLRDLSPYTLWTVARPIPTPPPSPVSPVVVDVDDAKDSSSQLLARALQRLAH